MAKSTGRIMNHFIYNIANEEIFGEGQIIFREGSSGDWIYVVIDGCVEMSKEIQGKKHIIGILRSGDLLGELEFFGKFRRTVTAMALEESTLGIIDRGFLEKEFNQLSGQFRNIIETITIGSRNMLNRAFAPGKRTEPRPVKALTLEFKDRQTFLKAYTGNLSSGGLFIQTEKLLPSGHNFPLNLQLPGVPGPLLIKCKVAWFRKPEDCGTGQLPGMGVKFTKISKKDYRILKGFISKL